MLERCWIIIALPLAGGALTGILGSRLPGRLVSLIGCLSVGLSLLFSLQAFQALKALTPQQRLVRIHLLDWIHSGALETDFGLLIDPLAVLMLVVVTGVGFLIHLYSLEYMRGKPGYTRFFAFLNLLIAMMTLLVAADNYLLSFVGWQGIALCSYLLIGQQLGRKSAGDAAKKAFLVNRVGDAFLILGILLLFETFGSLDYLTVFRALANEGPSSSGWDPVAISALLLLIGAVAKSAQIPFHIWLPDAMEAPIPASALIQTVTLGAAGIYLVVRSAALYSRAPDVLMVMAVTGMLTALLAALVALVQTDIRRVLAFSTISQLGYIFLALGVGAFGAGIFHLVTHAVFKALLLLGAGSIILAGQREPDLFRMGGLKNQLPLTWATMWVAALALSGFPLLSGFFSSNGILWRVFTSPAGHPLLWFPALSTVVFTSFYMFRLMILAFHGRSRQRSTASLDRRSAYFAKLPVLVLAALSVAGGVLGLPHYLGEHRLGDFLSPSLQYQYLPRTLYRPPSSWWEPVLMVLTSAAAAAGAYLAYRIYRSDSKRRQHLTAHFPTIRAILAREFMVDKLYEHLLTTPLRTFSEHILWKTIDRDGINGLVQATASFLRFGSRRIRRLQSGLARSYAALILVGVFLIVLYCWVAP